MLLGHSLIFCRLPTAGIWLGMIGVLFLCYSLLKIRSRFLLYQECFRKRPTRIYFRWLTKIHRHLEKSIAMRFWFKIKEAERNYMNGMISNFLIAMGIPYRFRNTISSCQGNRSSSEKDRPCSNSSTVRWEWWFTIMRLVVKWFEGHTGRFKWWIILYVCITIVARRRLRFIQRLSLGKLRQIEA